LVFYGNYASSNYSALQFLFQRQFLHGLAANASYTWAHSLDDASNFNSGAVFPFSVNYSSSDFDIRQTFAASVVYDAPTPFKRKALARAVLGHWSFDPFITTRRRHRSMQLRSTAQASRRDSRLPSARTSFPACRSMSTERSAQRNMAPAPVDSHST